MGYDCKQAMHYNEDRKQQVVAWYAPQLRPFLGPEKFNTLPGAVLEVNLNDGERVITAKNLRGSCFKEKRNQGSKSWDQNNTSRFSKDGRRTYGAHEGKWRGYHNTLTIGLIFGRGPSH